LFGSSSSSSLLFFLVQRFVNVERISAAVLRSLLLQLIEKEADWTSNKISTAVKFEMYFKLKDLNAFISDNIPKYKYPFAPFEAITHSLTCFAAYRNCHWQSCFRLWWWIGWTDRRRISRNGPPKVSNSKNGSSSTILFLFSTPSASLTPLRNLSSSPTPFLLFSHFILCSALTQAAQFLLQIDFHQREHIEKFLSTVSPFVYLFLSLIVGKKGAEKSGGVLLRRNQGVHHEGLEPSERTDDGGGRANQHHQFVGNAD
jgi:hypothetical protein